MNIKNILTVYLVIINIIAIIITVSDKRRASRRKRRISERTLLIVSALGGAVGMYITMLLIRHKTRKLKFMLGIPVIFFVELTAVLLVLNYAA